MRYSRLIVSLVDECVAASLGGYDVEDAVGHLDSGGDLIREMLIRLVCDPRVKSTIRPAHWWEDAAQDKLEELAMRMMKTDDLTREQAERMVEQFLSDYFFTMIQKISSPPIGDLAGAAGGGNAPGNMNGDNSGDNEGDADDSEDAEDGSAESREKEDAAKAAAMAGALDEMYDDPGLGEGDDGGAGTGRGSEGGETTREEEQHIELTFMRSIPSSLVRLARLIGRSGNTDLTPSGHFMAAAKSDIAGISVGNDLSSLLPSEVALLACAETQDVFLRNFAEKRLQVFASASSGGQEAERHQDGPVIICLDTSSSMNGRPAKIAAVLSMAVAIVAQRQRRQVLIVKYSEGHTLFKLKSLRKQRKALLKFLSSWSGTSNNEDDMFRWLFEEVIPGQGEFSSADILCVSDFGWTPVSADTFGKMKEYKDRGMIIYGLDTSGEGLSEFRLPEFIPRGEGSALPPQIIDSMWVWKESRHACIEEKRN